MIFRKEFVKPILEGKKTQSRRKWKKPLVKEGRIYKARTSYTSDYFAEILVNRVFKQKLGEMTEEDAKKEGCESLEEFKRVWERVTGEKWNPDEEVWVVEFSVVNRKNDDRSRERE
ncbi:MAG: ASCH domain-containing protein [Candidatus Baldrarchaeia archaeon]